MVRSLLVIATSDLTPAPDALYGTWKKPSATKAGWNLPQPKMANTDLSALLKSEAIRAVLRAPNRKVNRAHPHPLSLTPRSTFIPRLTLTPRPR